MSAITAQPHSPTAAQTQRPVLTRSTRIIYGLGDFGSNMIWTTTTGYLALFYTDTVGLAAGTVALLLLVARIFDAVIDPFIGALAERTRSKYGRFRPWILYGTFPLAIMMILTFWAPFPGNTTGAVVWAVATYGILGILYSAVNVPYGALAAVMTESSDERVSLNGWRIGFTQFANVFLALVTIPMVIFFSGAGDGVTQTTSGFFITIVILAVVGALFLFAVFAKTKEVIAPVAGTRIPFASTVRVLFTNAPLGLLFVGSLLIYMSFFGRIGVSVYYFIYNVADFALLSVFLAIPPAGAIVGIIAFSRFASRLGKRNLLVVSLLGQALSLFALFLIGWDNVPAIMIVSFIYGLALVGLPLVISMIPDVVDWTEDRTGVRADGTFYASYSFAVKLSSAIGGSAGIGLLAAYGFVANAQQTPDTLTGINVVTNLLPAVVSLVGIVPFLFYRITEKRVAEARARLDAIALDLASTRMDPS